MSKSFIPWLRSSVGDQEEEKEIKKTIEDPVVKTETDIEPKKSSALNKLKGKK